MEEIVVINMGGTIGMVSGVEGLYPTSSIAEYFKNQTYIEGELMDSSQLNYERVNALINLLLKHQELGSGFLLLTGTDTMAYLYHYLKWLLPFFKKPIVVTGSLVPLSIEPEEGLHNIEMSINALRENFQKPYRGLVMGDVLDAGSLEKVSTLDVRAFNSYQREEALLLPDIARRIFLGEVEVEVICCQPAMPLTFGPPKEALVLMTYGTGTLPENKGLLTHIENYRREKKEVVLISQVGENELDLNRYAASTPLRKLGVKIGSGYRLPEVITYLHVLWSLEGVKKNEW